ncbi:hypothetical protein F4780DRAFT_660111 [Xylariomycetidae sp. FL0641]|nr:hypothetical protein F4780DRAFT_660111 [Xylariomycetidae sp. FL0641]
MPLRIPHPALENVLHVYRHLLREATYLPLLARPWISERIRDRFRANRFEERKTKTCIKAAHQTLRYLRSANAGHVQRLKKLCFMATGRIGKRSRVLKRKLLSADIGADADALAVAAEITRGFDSYSNIPKRQRDRQDRHVDWLDQWSEQKIQAIASTQVENQNSTWPSQMRRTIDPAKAVPTESIWGVPFTPKLARNKYKKHYVGILDNLMAPLPEGEWHHLAALAQAPRDSEYLVLPSRRPVAQQQVEEPERSTKKAPRLGLSNPGHWSQRVRNPARVVERDSSRSMKSLSGEEDNDPRGHGRPIGVKMMHPRRLRRAIYGKVWEASPLLVQDPRTEKWSAVWGGAQRDLSRPSARELSFFEGLKDDGVPLPAKQLQSSIVASLVTPSRSTRMPTQSFISVAPMDL